MTKKHKTINFYLIACTLFVILVSSIFVGRTYAYFSALQMSQGSITMGTLKLDSLTQGDSTDLSFHVTNLMPSETVTKTYTANIDTNIPYYIRVIYKADVTVGGGKTHATGCSDNVTDESSILGFSVYGYTQAKETTEEGYNAFYKLAPQPASTTSESVVITLELKDWVGDGYCDYFMHSSISLDVKIQIIQANYLEDNTIGASWTDVNSLNSLWEQVFDSEMSIPSVDDYPNLTFTVTNTSAQTMSVKAANQSITEAIIPEKVTQDGVTYTVTSLDNSAFYYCTSLTSIEIPDSVTSIGVMPFYCCKNLTSIKMPKNVTGSIGVYAFYECNKLTSIEIPNGVTSIGDNAFADCWHLASIEIPNSVTSIGKYAFWDCSSLTSITFENTTGWHLDSTTGTSIDVTDPSTNATNMSTGSWCSHSLHREEIADVSAYSDTFAFSIIDDDAKTVSVCCANTSISGDIVIPEYITYEGTVYTVTEIAPNGASLTKEDEWDVEGGFTGCANLTSITISNSVTSIGSCSFYGCSSLTSITFENTTGWHLDSTTGTNIDVTNPSTNATNMSTGSWCSRYLYRVDE